MIDAHRRAKKGPKSSRNKKERHEPYVVGEEGRRVSCVTPDLSYDYNLRERDKKKGEHNKSDGKREKKKERGILT